MFGETFQNACLVLLSLSTVSAGFSNFFFAGNNGNSSELKTCPGSPFECAPPNVCAHDDNLDKYYCCIPGSQDAVCWAPSDDCEGEDTTPGGDQQGCGSGINAFCCLKSSEICTERQNQTNICWSTSTNPVASLNATAVNETAQSLESAKPSAASYTIGLAALETLTSTTASLSSATQSASATSSSATSATTSPSTGTASSVPVDNSDSGISGGAIGGIVGGVVGGLGLVGMAAFLLWRRRKNNKRNPYEAANSNDLSHADAEPSAVEMSSHQAYAEAPATEKYRSDARPLVEAPTERTVSELP